MFERIAVANDGSEGAARALSVAIVSIVESRNRLREEL